MSAWSRGGASRQHSLLVLLVCAMAYAPAGRGGEIADRIASYLDALDFNDYALSGNLYASRSLYDGVSDTVVLYPMLSSFEHSTTTNRTLFVRDANLGLRKVSSTGWEFGGFVKVQADGYGPETSDALEGMARRGWSVAGGLLVGRKLGPLRADLFASTDLFGRHGGQELNFKLAWPLVLPNMQFVPQVEAMHYSSNYLDYYYGVSPSEATPDRPAYAPGAATTWSVGFDSSLRLGPRWYLRASVGYDFLPDAIVASPIVDVDTAWRVGIGVAYDAVEFVSVDSAAGFGPNQGLEAVIEAFFMRAKTTINLRGSDPGSAETLENSNELDQRELAWPVELTWRVGRFHTFGLRYFKLVRHSDVTLDSERMIRGVRFAAGEELHTDLETSVLRVDYGFAFLRDPQKEFVVYAGLHTTGIEYAASGESEAVRAETTAYLPLVGASLRLDWTQRIELLVSAEVFALSFDQFEGELLDLAAALQYRIGKSAYVRGGYRYYRQRLESGDEDLSGELLIKYHGPYLGLSLAF